MERLIALLLVLMVPGIADLSSDQVWAGLGQVSAATACHG